MKIHRVQVALDGPTIRVQVKQTFSTPANTVEHNKIFLDDPELDHPALVNLA